MRGISDLSIPGARLSARALALIAAMAMAWPAMAVQTKLVRHDSYSDLAPGQLHSVSLTDKGRLTLAPDLQSLYRPDAEILWAMAVAPDGRVFYGAGHEGKIFVTDRKASGTVFLDTDAPEVTALVFHDGKLYAGTAPDGKLWVCDPPGTATLVFDTEQEYIWDLLVAPDGDLIVATGDEGKIFRVDPGEKEGKLLWDAPDDNVLSLAMGPEDRLHAATQGKGRLYRWDEDRQTTPVVLLEAPKDEIRRIVVDPEGNIFAAANSEVIARRVVSSLSALLKKASDASKASDGNGSSDSSKPGPKTLKPSVPPGASSVYLIDNEGFVRELWKATEAPIHDMVYDAGRDSVVIAAGNKGKIFRLDLRGDYSVVLSVEEEQVFALEPGGERIYLATVGPAATYRLGDALARKGHYLSPALNAEASVRWGTLRREGEKIGEIEVETRSGNTQEPDGTWYDWKPVKWTAGSTDGRVQSPVARYLQWRAQFKASRGDEQPELDLVEIFYAPANEAPHIEKIEVKKAKPPKRPSPGSSKSSSGSSSAKKTKGGDGEDFDVPAHSNVKRFEIAWQVDDPNNDPLEAALYFKGEDESTWKLIKDKLTQPKHLFNTGTLPDGLYRIKVVVTDRLGNFGPNVRRDELISDRFVIDNTPPEVKDLKAAAVPETEHKWRVSARVTDATSLIASAKYNIDGQRWHVLVPVDALFDERTERLEFETDKLKGEEHVLGLVVTDREGNSSVGKVLLRP